MPRALMANNQKFSSNCQPYGAQYGATATDPTYKYTSKPQSPTTGLYYYGARWYNTTLGRFLTRDPNPGYRAQPQTMNPYVYVVNNPLRYTDPSGEWPWDAATDWWNSLSPQQKGIVIVAAIVVVTVVAVVAVQPELIGVDAELGGAAAADLAVEGAADSATVAADVTADAGASTIGLEGTSAGSSVTSQLLHSPVGNGAVSAVINVGGYVGQSLATGQPVTLRGALGAGVSGFVSGVLGSEGFEFTDSASAAGWLGNNIAAGETSYLAGQVAQGQAPTVGGVLEAGLFSIPAGGASEYYESTFPGLRGVAFGSTFGLGQNLYDAITSIENIPNPLGNIPL